MRISDNCIKLIKHHEGVRNTPYQDPIGLWTVGVGHLMGNGKTRPKDWSRKRSDAEVDELLRKDIARFENGVDSLITVDLNQNQFDALVCFAFNVGNGNLQASTLRRKLNRGDFEGAADEFPKWRKAAGRVLPGLVKRRKDERTLFLS